VLLDACVTGLPEHFSKPATQLAQSTRDQHPGRTGTLSVAHPSPLPTHCYHSLLLSTDVPQCPPQNAGHLEVGSGLMDQTDSTYSLDATCMHMHKPFTRPRHALLEWCHENSCVGHMTIYSI